MGKRFPTSHREKVTLPIGYDDPATGGSFTDAEVRAVTGADEMFIAMSPEYGRHQNDIVYKNLLLSRCVTRLGPRTLVTLDDILRLHAEDLRVLELAVYRITYGEEALAAEVGGPG